jgi:hypothetical protein
MGLGSSVLQQHFGAARGACGQAFDLSSLRAQRDDKVPLGLQAHAIRSPMMARPNASRYILSPSVARLPTRSAQPPAPRASL